jgi:hypothetical protein
MYKNATVAEWYKTHGKHQIYAKGKSVELKNEKISLYVNAEDAARVRPKQHDIPITAAEEERQRRKAAWEEQQAHQYYAEMVLKQPKSDLVQIGVAAPEVSQEVDEKVPA